jgi:nucleoporin GLE1
MTPAPPAPTDNAERTMRASATETFYGQLDASSSEQEAVHRAALAAAAAEHARIRQSAEVARAKFENEVQRKIAQRREEERRQLERLREERRAREREEERAKWEEEERVREMQEKEEREERERREDERRRREWREAEERERERERKEREEDGKRQKEKEEEDKQRAQLEAQKVAALPAAQAPATQPDAAPSPAVSQQSGVTLEAKRQQFEAQMLVEIHKRLKQLRKFMVAQSKQNEALKKSMGDMRRQIRKSVGQLTEGKGANRSPVCFTPRPIPPRTCRTLNHSILTHNC